jgi:hypothetical protein
MVTSLDGRILKMGHFIYNTENPVGTSSNNYLRIISQGTTAEFPFYSWWLRFCFGLIIHH